MHTGLLVTYHQRVRYIMNVGVKLQVSVNVSLFVELLLVWGWGRRLGREIYQPGAVVGRDSSTCLSQRCMRSVLFPNVGWRSKASSSGKNHVYDTPALLTLVSDVPIVIQGKTYPFRTWNFRCVDDSYSSSRSLPHDSAGDISSNTKYPLTFTISTAS